MQYVVGRYAETLAARPDLWATAASYAASCGVCCASHARCGDGAARGTLEALLTRVQPQCDRAARQLVAVCVRHGMPALAATVCHTRARVLEGQGRIAAAAAWLLQTDVSAIRAADVTQDRQRLDALGYDALRRSVDGDDRGLVQLMDVVVSDCPLVVCAGMRACVAR